MNIVVCIKQVPESPKLKMDRDRMTVIREGADSVINPLDCVALVAGVELRNQLGGEITVLSMGPPQTAGALREALAYGADRAILLSDPVFAGADTLATSHVLASAISRLDAFPDLVLCGTHTIDSDTAHVGPQVAEELDLPQVCAVNEIYPEEDGLVVKRVEDGVLETLRVRLPALLTVSKELCAPGSLSLGGLSRAFSFGEVTCWDHRDLGLEPGEVGFEGSATWVVKLSTPPPRSKGEIVQGTSAALCETLIRKLESLGILDEESAE